MLIKRDQIIWTKHSQKKMAYYHLSKQRVRRILRHPDRVEEGIAPQTVAVMQKYGSKKRPKELWVMLQEIGSKIGSRIRIISAWRYPGISPKGQPPIEREDLEFLA